MFYVMNNCTPLALNADSTDFSVHLINSIDWKEEKVQISITLLYINWIVLTSTAEGTAVVKHFVRTKKQTFDFEGRNCISQSQCFSVFICFSTLSNQNYSLDKPFPGQQGFTSFHSFSSFLEGEVTASSGEGKRNLRYSNFQCRGVTAGLVGLSK